MLIPAGVEHYIEPTGEETVENIDVFAPARSDYVHLLEWMTSDPRA
jgi:mannose-6-phosphate isomerase-like protein (cupin superfamily)